MPHPHTWLITAVLGLALLAGCGSEPTPLYADPSSPSAPTSSAASTATPSVDPSQETAKQFAARWVSLSVSVQNTGLTQPFAAVSSPHCKGCNSLMGLVHNYYSAGGEIHAGMPHVTGIDLAGRNGPLLELLVHVRVNPSTYRKRRGGALRTFDGGRATLDIYVERKGGRWEVTEYYNRVS